ncbi:DinB family protein [Rossellomorea aquimaris]|uniref:DinB family protein n=1 Tax=Rossellomorea aquimaris TaxID=189382 RepID=UPI0018D3989D|nr:DinB family protein [Rossellomorea aquimaris]
MEVRERLKESFIHLPEEKLNEKPAAGEWSIAQIILHLAGAEKRFIKLAWNAAEEEAEATGEDIDLSVFEDTSKKLKAPIEPTDEPKSTEYLVQALDESRQETLRFINKYSKEDIGKKAMNHHRFGNMPIWQVFELLGMHESRHIFQIDEVKNRIL